MGKIIHFCLLILFTLNISYAQQFMYVSSRNDHSVKKYDAQTGDYIEDIITSTSGGLQRTQEVLFGPDGHLYVSGLLNTKIKKYNSQTGEFIEDFTSGYDLENPTKMTFHTDGFLYVSQWGENQPVVVRFDANTGEFVDVFTKIGVDKENACGHAWDSEGNFYLANFTSQVVRKFDSNGNDLGIFVGDLFLAGPVNIWFAENGNLLVLDWQAGQVREFSGNDGSFIKVFIDGLGHAEGFTFDEEGNIYVCDWSNNLINKYDPEGNFIEIFASGGGLASPNSVVFGSPVITDVSDNIDFITNDYSLLQNYPNPFNPTTVIKYQVPNFGDAIRRGVGSPTNISLVVYDILGNKVSTLVNEQKNAGQYEIVFDASELTSGIYFYTLNAGQFSETKKMLLIK